MTPKNGRFPAKTGGLESPISTRIILSDARERCPRPFFGNKLPLEFKW